MDFFARQEKARFRTRVLVFYFILSVLLTGFAVYLAVTLLLVGKGNGSLWNPQLLFPILGGTALVVAGGSAVRMAELRQGGGVVARRLGGRLILPETQDPAERQIRNVVEEMALASGTPVPEIYLLEQEEGINAFAAGYSTGDMAVGITKGCLKYLTRDELQGVIAHEFSHILNGDMRLNMKLMGWVHGLLCVAIAGRVLLYTSMRPRFFLGARDRRGGNPLPVLGLALMAIGSIGVFFGHLIKSAVSRQREFLADAAAVQFTRNPSGIAGALKKIGGAVYGSKLQSPHAEEASHLLFGNGLKSSWAGLFSTHPPLKQRIQAIDPAFDGKFVRLTEPVTAPQESKKARVRPPPLPPIMVPAMQFLSHAGEIPPEALRYRGQVHEAMNPLLERELEQPLGAIAGILAMLFSSDPSMASRQEEHVKRAGLPGLAGEIGRLLPLIRQVERSQRLAMAELALPALRTLSPPQAKVFADLMSQLALEDQKIELFEFSLQKFVTTHLDRAFSGNASPVVEFYSWKPLIPDCQLLLSLLSRCGNPDPTAQRAAFEEAAAALRLNESIDWISVDAVGMKQIGAAIDRISQAVPFIRQRMLEAGVRAVSHDGVLSPDEWDLLRMFASAWNIPVPPVVGIKQELQDRT